MQRLLLSASSVLLLWAAQASADVKLPSVLSSNMVLQRDKPVPIWGWADPGEEVTVSFAGQEVTTKADAAGKWKLNLSPMKANAKGQKLTVKGANTLTLDDVLVGEVWVGSGQSNMEWSLDASSKAKETIGAANHPTIRL